MTNLEQVIKTAAEMGATNALVALGITSGELSARKAEETYGKWFRDSAATGRIKPVRVGNGATGTRWFKVTEILALKAMDELKAQIKF